MVSEPRRPTTVNPTSPWRSCVSAVALLLFVGLPILIAAGVTVFGPETFRRGNGKPERVSKKFTVNDLKNPYQLRVTNHGVTSAVITLNGRVILEPKDFTLRRGRRWRDDEWDRHTRGRDDSVHGGGEPENDGRDRRDRDDRNDRDDGDDRDHRTEIPVPFLARSVTLRSGRNEIVVEVRGVRGSSLTVEIVGSTENDTTPPTIVPVVSPPPNANGWHKDRATVSFQCSDAGSGIATCPAPIVVSTEGAGQRFSGTAVDNAGNPATATATVSLDKTLPIVTAAATPMANGDGWNKGPVLVTFGATDALSGIAPGSLTAPLTLSMDGANLSATGQAQDRAGNIGTTTLSGINIDQVNPTISVALTGPMTPEGIFTGPVTAHFTCGDAGSGIATCPADRVVTSAGAGQTVTGTATDRAGNSAGVTSAPFTIRPPMPVITVSLSPAPNASGWRKPPVVAHFTCTQNGQPLAGCPADVSVSTDGADQTVTASVTDAVGQTAAVTSEPFNIDQTQPAIVVSLTPPPSGALFNMPVTAHFTCADALSGVADCPPDQVIATDGINFTLTGTATDHAGNTASATSDPFSLDSAPPLVTLTLSPEPNASGWNNSQVTAHFTCSDSGSGVASCPPDQVLSADGAGQVVRGTATDAAGNSAPASATASIDRALPTLVVSAPVAGATVFTPTVSVSGHVDDPGSGIDGATCNGLPASVAGGVLSCQVSLSLGSNVVSVVVTDRADNQRSASLDLTYARVPIVTIISPANLSYANITTATVTGTVDDPTATVTVNSIPAPVDNGSFTLPLPLAEGPNIVTATATATTGAVGTASIEVTLDTTPPHVTITSPSGGFVTTDAAVSVAGNVNDIVVGTVNEQQAQVTVNGAAATVANRTFLAADVPLSLGPNTITAVARDRVGNSATTQVTVTRQPSTAPQIHLVSGNNQSGPIGTLLPQPLIVRLSDAADNPVPAGQQVIFRVTDNDGLVSGGGTPAPTAIVQTDGQGRAQAQWTLGHRAGAGGNRVEAYAVGYQGIAVFTASGTQGAPDKIVVDTGNDQIGNVGQLLPKPFIAVVVDQGNNRLGGVPVTFTVISGGGNFDGQPTSTVVSDPDGRVAGTLVLGPGEGNANNVVRAAFNSAAVPATFTASGRIPGNPAQTTITGVVLDNSNLPIAGVTVRAVLTAALRSSLTAVAAATEIQTNQQGQFVIPQAPVGLVKLLVDGVTAQRPGEYPSLEYDMITVAGRDNTVGQPIYLLPLSTANKLCVTATSGGGTLTIPEAPGFSLTFAPGQVTFPGASKVGCVTVTVVHADKMPMVPGFGQQPRFIVTIQPAGAVFNPPAPITLPNVDGLRPRQITEMYSYDHDISAFVAIGTGTVSDDGLTIRSNPGVGVLKAGWHCGGDPSSSGSAASLSVSLSPSDVTKEATETADFTASGSPPEDGQYTWELVATEAGDDTTVATLTASPSCANQQTCTATIRGEKPGTVTLRVTFTCTTTGATTTAESRITIAVSAMLKEVTYSGGAFHDVAKDKDGTNYPAPQWLDANDNGSAADSGDNRFPISYTRNSTVTLSAKFTLSHAVTNASAKITGDGNGLHFESTVTGISGTTMTMPVTTSTGTLPNTIKKMDPLQIEWKVSFDAGNSYPASSFTAAGSSDNVTHVTLGDPTTTPLYETVLDIGTRSAGGASTEPAAVAGIWGEFTTRNVKRADGVIMRYWNPPATVCQSIATMLADSIANGSCIAWSQTLNRALKAQGIAGSQIFEIEANTAVNPGADGFLVKNWRFGRHIRTGPNGVLNSTRVGDDVALGLTGPDEAAIGPGPNGVLDSVAGGDDTVQDGYFNGARYPYVQTAPIGDAADQLGIPGQFNPDPPGGFLNHFVVKYGGQVYDPSYGAGPFASELAHENAAIDGISSGARVKKNDAAQELKYTGTAIQ